MRKFLALISLLFFLILFIACSYDNNSSAPVEIIQGKWQLTSYTDDIGDTEDPQVENGYVLNLKSDGTFTSNEIPGYSSGTYSIINSPGKNIKLVYKTKFSSATYYKYFNGIYGNGNMYTVTASTTPYPDLDYLGWQILSRVP